MVVELLASSEGLGYRIVDGHQLCCSRSCTASGRPRAHPRERGGGSWGPVVTTSLLGVGNDPRTTIDLVNAAGFFLAIAC